VEACLQFFSRHREHYPELKVSFEYLYGLCWKEITGNADAERRKEIFAAIQAKASGIEEMESLLKTWAQELPELKVNPPPLVEEEGLYLHEGLLIWLSRVGGLATVESAFDFLLATHQARLDLANQKNTEEATRYLQRVANTLQASFLKQRASPKES
jgi:hypothetical protein